MRWKIIIRRRLVRYLNLKDSKFLRRVVRDSIMMSMKTILHAGTLSMEPMRLRLLSPRTSLDRTWRLYLLSSNLNSNIWSRSRPHPKICSVPLLIWSRCLRPPKRSDNRAKVPKGRNTTFPRSICPSKSTTRNPKNKNQICRTSNSFRTPCYRKMNLRKIIGLLRTEKN